MSLKTARVLAATYLILMAVSVTWPGMLVASRIRPILLGLPFPFFWVAAWVAGTLPMLWLLDRVERRYRDGGDA